MWKHWRIRWLALSCSRSSCQLVPPPKLPVNPFRLQNFFLLQKSTFYSLSFNPLPERDLWCHFRWRHDLNPGTNFLPCNIYLSILSNKKIIILTVFRMNLTQDEIRVILSEVLKLLATPEFQTQLDNRARPQPMMPLLCYNRFLFFWNFFFSIKLFDVFLLIWINF